MWKCPVCGRKNKGNIICDCGWNRSKDYSKYATVCPIGKKEKKMLSESLYGTGYLMKKAEALKKKEQWSEAISFYEKAAEKGDLEAMKYLGKCFREGLGTKKNLYKALDWYCRIMIDEKEDVSLLMDDLYEEIKGSRKKKADRSHGDDRQKSSIPRANTGERKPAVKKKVLDKNFFSVLEGKIDKDQIQTIMFENKLPKSSSVQTYTVSADGSVRLWMGSSENGHRGVDLYIGANGGVDAAEDCSELFRDFTNVKSIVFQNNFRTCNVKNMSSMFYGCKSLEKLDLSGFDTKNVKDMDHMFAWCESLSELDLSGVDTKNVENMSSMFAWCESLSELDLSGFDTKNVKDMSSMFDWCGSLSELDLSWFDTKNVKYMTCMFERCESLSELDLSRFDTKNVEDMSYMFRWCRSLRKLNLSNFDTSNVWDMDCMFFDCSQLDTYVGKKFNTSNVQTMEEMFQDCRPEIKKAILGD